MLTPMLILVGALLGASSEDTPVSSEGVLAEWDAKRRLGFSCVPGTPETLEATAHLNRLGEIVESLERGTSGEAFQDAYSKLRQHRCFRGIGDLVLWLSDGSPEVLALWWKEGGEEWLRSMLSYPSHRHRITLPPDLRVHLTPELAPWMASGMCEPGASDCAAEAGWWKRADLELNAAVCRRPPSACSVQSGIPKHEQYAAWTWCADESLARGPALPWGRFRVPSTGWLVVRDTSRRNAKRACEVTEAFSLETGDVWMINTCEQQGRKVGRVAVEPLRQLSLLLLVARHAPSHVRTRAHQVTLPPGLEPQWFEVPGSLVGRIKGGMIGHYGFRENVRDLDFSWKIVTDGSAEEGRWRAEDEDDPCKPYLRLVLSRLKALEGALERTCPEGVQPPKRLFRPAGRIFSAHPEVTAAEQLAFEQLNALMRTPSSACRGNTPPQPTP